MEFSTELLLKKHPEAGHFYFEIPFDIAAFFLEKGEKRAVCRLADAHDVHFAFSFLKKEDGRPLIMVSKTLAKTLKMRVGETVAAVFREDMTENQWPMPAELAEVLATDPEAEAAFLKMTAGARRTILVKVGTYKSSEKRIEKALIVAEKLRQGETAARLVQWLNFGTYEKRA